MIKAQKRANIEEQNKIQTEIKEQAKKLEQTKEEVELVKNKVNLAEQEIKNAEEEKNGLKKATV